MVFFQGSSQSHLAFVISRLTVLFPILAVGWDQTMAENELDTTVHRIDAHGIICYVDDAFRNFASAAGVPDLPDRALGTPLLDHIAGDTTKQWYRSLFVHVIRHGAASFDCRCDSPTVQRHQRMFVRRLANQGIEMQTTTLCTTCTTPRPRADVFDLTIPHSQQTVQMCSLCLRVPTVIGWLAVDEAAHILQVFQGFLPPALQYTICNDAGCAQVRFALS
jgi:hypothetical protein